MIFDAALSSAFGGTNDPQDPVYHTIRLLRNAAADEWTTTPRIREYWAHAQSERGPGQGQSPIVYVWSPTTSTLDRFSMDGTRFDQTDTIECQIWTLDESLSARLQSDVVHVLGKYLDDNRVNTPYSTVEPVGRSDFREQKPARDTRHYVMSVELEARGLSATRDVDGSVFESGFDDGFA